MTTDLENSTHLRDSVVWRYKRIFGFIAKKIEECKAENTSTGFKIEVTCRVNYLSDAHTGTPDKLSRLYVRIRAYSANCLLTDPQAFMMGGPVTGVLTANYGGSGRSALGCWRLSSLTDCALCSPDTVSGSDFGDFSEWATTWAPVLG